MKGEFRRLDRQIAATEEEKICDKVKKITRWWDGVTVKMEKNVEPLEKSRPVS